MNNDQFTYWLQGFVEMNGGKEPTKQQWQIIKDHLKLCFNKVTPSYPQLEPYRDPIQPPFKVTCTSYPLNYNNLIHYEIGGFRTTDGTLHPYPKGAGGGGGIQRNGGGGGC